MVKRTVLALVLAVAFVVWMAPDVRAAAVGTRFDVTLYGSVRIYVIQRDAVGIGDSGSPIWAAPDRIITATAGTEQGNQKQGQLFMYLGHSRFGFRIKGPDMDLGFLGKPKSSALLEADWDGNVNASGTAGRINAVGRLRGALLDFDWEGKTVTTKLRVGHAPNWANGITFMSVQDTPWFGGSLSTPHSPQVTLAHTIKLAKNTNLLAAWGATFGRSWSPGLQFRDPWTEADEPGWEVAFTLTSVLYGKKPVLLKTDFVWNRFEERLSTVSGVPIAPAPIQNRKIIGDHYIWTNALVIPTPGYEDLTWNAELAFAQVGGSGMTPAMIIVPNARNLLCSGDAGCFGKIDTRQLRSTSWWTGINWTPTKKLTVNAAYGEERADPDQVPLAFAAPPSAAAAGEFFKIQREYAFNFWYKLSDMVTGAVEYRKRMAEYQNSKGFQPRPFDGVLTRTIDIKDGSHDQWTFALRIDF